MTEGHFEKSAYKFLTLRGPAKSCGAPATTATMEDVPNLRNERRPRECRSGIGNRLRKRPHNSPLPSYLLVNFQSLENKLGGSRARITFQNDVWDDNLICLTKTWLSSAILDRTVQPVELFSVHHTDTTEESVKSRGRDVCLILNNNKWCAHRNIVSLSHLCSPNLELLTIKCPPFYLPP